MSAHTPTPWPEEDSWILGCGTDPENCVANYERGIACVNAFHSSDGRNIPTEAIMPGLFWEMQDAMQEFCDRVQRGEVRSKYTYGKFKALLATLKIEEPKDG